jgi:hypothetical protein
MNRIAILNHQDQALFHTQDLALLWGISNPNTLYTTIKRYSQKRVLFPIHKGFYATKPPGNIHPWLLGIGALHHYAYVSTETILNIHGVINPYITSITLVGSTSKTFTLLGSNYRCRKLHDKHLYNHVGIVNDTGINQATLERAVADLLYFNPRAYFDNPQLVNWPQVKRIQKTLGYPQP